LSIGLFFLFGSSPAIELTLEEMMREWGSEADHLTINQWVLKYAPELDKRIPSHWQPTNDSW
jgi:transposase-like protein